MTLYQYIIAGISLWFIVSRLMRFIRREQAQSFVKLMTFLLVWSAIFVIAVFPRAASSIANLVGLNGNINIVILLGFIVVFLLLFKLLSVIEHIERNITEIVRRDALRDVIDRQKQT